MTEAERRTTIAEKLRLGFLRWRPPDPKRDEHRLRFKGRETMRPVDSPGRHVCSGCGQRLIDTDSGRGSKELRYELATLWYDAICFELWQEERKTIVFITHDLGEAVALADRVVVMSARPGRIKTIAPVPIPRPRNLFEIHTDERFRETYRALWASLEEEVKKGAALWQP